MPEPRRVFITGALGFIARALGRRYREAGAEVRGVDRSADPGLGIVAGDVTRAGEWQRAAAGCDLVIHTAAILGLAGEQTPYWQVNVVGTRNALDAAVAAGASRFVQLSSVLAFSWDFPDGVDERYPVRCNGAPYVDTKVASEQVVLQAHAAGEIDCTVIRPGDVYGPGSRPWTITPVEMIKKNRFVLPRGGVFSPVYVDNLVDGIWLATSSAEAAGEVFIVTDGAGVPNERFFGRYFDLLGKRGPRRLPAGLLRSAGHAAELAAKLTGAGETYLNRGSVAYLTRRGSYSIAKARRVLGYEPRVDLDEGMARTEQWLRANGYAAAAPRMTA